MQIKLTERLVYGRPLYYPACPLSTMIAEIVGRSSLSARFIEIFERYGYKIEYVKN